MPARNLWWSTLAITLMALDLGACALQPTGGTTTGTAGQGGTGGGVTTSSGCNTATDCPGSDTSCQQRTCTAGVCGLIAAPLGTPAGPSPTGDCHAIVCDGQGATTVIADDTDVPDDGNPCTADLCSGGVPSHVDHPMGTPCGMGGPTACDGHGHCQGCLADSDCGASTACASPTCNGGTCAINYVPLGEGSPSGQAPGACMKVACNGNGGTTLVADPTVLPDDGNPCTNDLCNGATAYHTTVSAGVACGAGLVCDGNDHCVGCASDGDCGVNTPCVTHSCDIPTGTCVINYFQAGVGDPGGQTAGDCTRLVCNGSGGVMAIADGFDVPDDGNPCTSDLCNGFIAYHAPVADGVACGAGLACDGNNHCVGCVADSDCGVSTACASHTCNTATGACVVNYVPLGQGDPGGQTPGDCMKLACNGSGGSVLVADPTDLPTDGNPCTSDLCNGSTAHHTPVSAGVACGAGLVCDGNNHCVGCLTDSDCGASTPCTSHTCDGATGTCVVQYVPAGQGNPGGQAAGDCVKLTCNGSGGTMQVTDTSDVPNDGNPCTTDVCNGSTPQHAPAPAGTSCGPGQVCNGAGQCGGACLSDLDCQPSGPCTSSHCNTTTGLCVSSPLSDGTSCTAGTVCSTAGVCQSGSCAPLSQPTCPAPDSCHFPMACNPSTGCPSQASLYPLKPLGTSCTTPFGNGVCSSTGVCVGGCFVNGTIYPPNNYFTDTAICLRCDPSVSTSSFYTGTCHWNGQPGNCSGDGVCNLLGADCNAGCSDCSAQQCGIAMCTGLPKPYGTACPDDGNPCTSDVCNAFGGCIHLDVAEGTPCGSGMTCHLGNCQ